MTIQTMNDESVQRLGQAAITLAELEGLKGHANAVRVRLKEREVIT